MAAAAAEKVRPLRRVEYDIDETLAHMVTNGMPRWAVELSEAVLRTGGQVTREQMDSYV